MTKQNQRRPKKRGPKAEILKLDVDPLRGIQRLVEPKDRPKPRPAPKK